MTKLSSRYLSQKWRVWGRAKGTDFELFHKQVGNEGANGGIHGSTMDLFIILTLEEEVCVFEANIQKCDNLFYGHVGPWGSGGSWGNFCLTMMIEGSTGTEVKRALTSYDVITYLV